MNSQGGFYGWKLLAVMWVAMFANCGLPIACASVGSPYMAAALHLSRSTLGFSFAVFYWMSGLPAPLAAFSVNKKGVRFTLAVGALLVTAGSIWMAQFVHTGVQVVVAFGIVIGLGFVLGGSLTAQAGMTRWFERRRAAAMSLVLTGGNVAGVVAPPVLTWLIERAHGNWHVAWWVAGSLGALSTVLAALFVRESPADLGQFPDGAQPLDAPAAAAIHHPSAKPSRVFRTSEDWTFGEAMRSPFLWPLLLSSAGFLGGFYMFLAHGMVHLRDLGHSPERVAASFAAVGLFTVVGTLIVAGIGDRIEPRYIMAVAMLCCAIGLVLVLNATGTVFLYLYAVFLGFASGGLPPSLMTVIANYFGGKAFPSVMGISLTCGTMIGGVASYGAGYAFDRLHNYAVPFYAMAVFCLLGFIILLRMRSPVRRPRPLVTTAVGM